MTRHRVADEYYMFQMQPGDDRFEVGSKCCSRPSRPVLARFAEAREVDRNDFVSMAKISLLGSPVGSVQAPAVNEEQSSVAFATIGICYSNPTVIDWDLT